MAYRTLAANDISARQVDAGIKNTFKWCWLEESVTLPGGKSVKFDECFRKISLSGKVLCVFCNDTINYASILAGRRHYIVMSGFLSMCPRTRYSHRT